DDLAWLADAIGAVRDRDVLFAALKTAAIPLEPGLRKAFGAVALAVHDERSAALETLGTALDSDKCRRLVQRLAPLLEGPAARRLRRGPDGTAAGSPGRRGARAPHAPRPSGPARRAEARPGLAPARLPSTPCPGEAASLRARDIAGPRRQAAPPPSPRARGA